MKPSSEDRERLVEVLIARSVPAVSVHPAWDAEIARRVADMDAGLTRWVPADEAMARLSAHIQIRRPTA